MLVCQVATYSPICIPMSLQESMQVDKCLLKAYQNCLHFMPCDAKHSTFLSEKRGGLGLHSFTREYMGSLIRDIEVYITNKNTTPAHALAASIEEASKRKLWIRHQNNALPNLPLFLNQVQQYQISERKTIVYGDSFECPTLEEISCDHPHVMDHAIEVTSALGLMLRDLNQEACARFADELRLGDHVAKTVCSPNILGRRKLGVCFGEGNRRFYKYSIPGHVYSLLIALLKDIRRNVLTPSSTNQNIIIDDQLSRPRIYRQHDLFPK